MAKVLVTGPESSGKTTLAAALAAHYQVPWNSEFAREYLDGLGRPYVQADLRRILSGQLIGEHLVSSQSPTLSFHDTGAEVVYVWSEVKYGSVDTWIRAEVEAADYDLRLLCRPDIPWVADPLREAADDLERGRLFDRYVGLFQSLGQSFEVIEGEGRLGRALGAVDGLLG